MRYMQVRDDRGATRRMLSPFKGRQGRGNGARDQELRAMQLELWMKSLWGQAAFAFFLLSSAALFVIGLLITAELMSMGDSVLLQGEVPSAFGPMTMAMGGIIGALLGWGRWRRHKRGPDHWRLWLDACRRCPACEYDMAGLDPEPDNCLECPECGGAWRLPER